MSVWNSTNLQFAAVLLLSLLVTPASSAPASKSPTTGVDQTTPAPTNSAAKSKLKLDPGQTAIYFKDLHCKHCAAKVARKLFAVKGVVKVQTDLKTDIAVVTPQSKKKLDPTALWNAAKKAGFPVLKLVGPDGTFQPDPKTKKLRRLVERQPSESKKG